MGSDYRSFDLHIAWRSKRRETQMFEIVIMTSPLKFMLCPSEFDFAFQPAKLWQIDSCWEISWKLKPSIYHN
ncbi:hypothetical protein C5167_026917 [Papaver somniferum]|nr:hypothetical protein C5167_026917 [Papaver somniferum]